MNLWCILDEQEVGYQTCNMLFTSSQHFFSLCAMLHIKRSKRPRDIM
jgi:hypothetical protein